MITYGRDAMIEEVWKIVLGDIVYIPLHHQLIVWAMRDNLELPVYPFNHPLFREARLTAPEGALSKASPVRGGFAMIIVRPDCRACGGAVHCQRRPGRGGERAALHGDRRYGVDHGSACECQ